MDLWWLEGVEDRERLSTYEVDGLYKWSGLITVRLQINGKNLSELESLLD